jgi:molecular chaperone GrpE (heat shock protein)
VGTLKAALLAVNERWLSPAFSFPSRWLPGWDKPSSRMTDRAAHQLSKWPFFLGDALLLGVAGLVLWQGARPLAMWEMVLLASCVAAGAGLCVIPFILEYRYLSKLAQVERLQRTLLQVHNIEGIARQIASATSCWQAIQDDARKAVDASREITDSMTSEARAFQQFLEKANDTERGHLRLEVEKLRRAEADWLQVIIRVLDHVFALFLAAVRSGQPGLIEQLTGFQRACREVALRVGLVPFEAQAGEPFDKQRHRTSEEGEVPEESRVGETLATGYRFQGQQVRKALVSLQGERPGPSPLSISQIRSRREHASSEPGSAAARVSETDVLSAP